MAPKPISRSSAPSPQRRGYGPVRRTVRSWTARSSQARQASSWLHDLFGDLELLALTLVGYVPSHSFRRWVYRGRGLRLDPTSSLHWKARFFAPAGITVGPYTTIGNDAFLDGRDGITIGSSVNVAAEVRIYTREHDVQSRDFAEVGGAVIIDDFAYLGTRVTVLPGVRIGTGAVVATGAVVTKNVEPFTIVGGVPARPIGSRTKELRYRLGYAKRFQ